MKGKLLILSLFGICMAMLAGGTSAFFTAEGRTHSVITTGAVEIRVQEWADEERTRPLGEVTGVMPNTTVTKIAEVKNTGGQPAWVRVRLRVQVTSRDREPMDPAPVALRMNSGAWIFSQGWYYYPHILQPGQVTAPIFTAVTFDPAMGNGYQNAAARVEVFGAAVQSANNGASFSEASGWPEEEREGG